MSLLIISSQLSGRSRFFRFRQAALSLMNTNKQSLPQEDPDAVMVDSPKENEDSVALQSFPSPTKSICSPIEANDTQGLISSSRHSSQASVGHEPVDQSSPKLPWEKLYQTEAHQSSTTLSNTFPRGSINSMRRASSVHEIEGYSNSKSIFGDRHTSEGMWYWTSLAITSLSDDARHCTQIIEPIFNSSMYEPLLYAYLCTYYLFVTVYKC